MNLEIIRTQTTWNDAAGSINSNYAKIADAIAQLKANGGSGGSGADIDLTAYATKVWVESKGYITASALTPYALKTDIPSLVGYATEDFVNNQLGDYATKDYVTTKLVDYAPLTSIQGFENRIAGLEGAVPQLNEKVSTVEGEVSTLNEIVSTGENNLLDRVNTIETDYVTSDNLESAINDIDLSIYLKTEDAEDTYATKDYVNNKLTNYATTDSVTAIQNTLTGQIGAVGARVDSNDEQIAILNETTSGHTTSIGTLTQRVDSVEQLAATKLDSSYFTLTNIKSTLGISDWALAAIKPSYTASEVGATPSLGNVGANSVKGNGLGYTYATSAHGGHTAGGFISFGNTSYGCQLNGSIYGGELAFRGLNNGTFTDWKTLAFASDIPTKLSQLTDDVVAGKYALLGNPNNLMCLGNEFIFASNNFSGNIYINYRTVGGLNGNITAYSFFDGNSGLLGTISKDYFSGNSASATKLQTPRSLWGQSFDGTAAVSGNVEGSNFLIMNRATNPYLSLTDAYGTVYFQIVNGNAYIGSTDSKSLMVDGSGNVGIGTTLPTERLDVSGNIKASGNINATSITINGVTITASNGSITVNGNVLATGDITGCV